MHCFQDTTTVGCMPVTFRSSLFSLRQLNLLISDSRGNIFRLIRATFSEVWNLERFKTPDITSSLAFDRQFTISFAVAEMGDHLATIDIGRLRWAAVSLSRGAGLTECSLGQGLPLYQMASWSIQPFGYNRHGPQIEGGCAPFLVGGVSWVAMSNTMWPRPMPTSVPSGILIHPAVWPQ